MSDSSQFKTEIEEFLTDKTLRRAFARSLEIIGEAAKAGDRVGEGGSPPCSELEPR